MEAISSRFRRRTRRFRYRFPNLGRTYAPVQVPKPRVFGVFAVLDLPTREAGEPLENFPLLRLQVFERLLAVVDELSPTLVDGEEAATHLQRSGEGDGMREAREEKRRQVSEDLEREREKDGMR